ncbi:efflux RND transporter permease subunit [Limibaculum sp. M0105]|uniref:Efflux RND transporter permease subunit n=1 Tax=Thermohalobaculum xanthum TaxID=2753746 RepID=A0A8J7SC89_9RHOB|nr:efflux RND transporter permease subunit [Thermohalobaculum xanthum]MBK0398101.1 efflux RND transporter permease subunit [Thermohalobaculum xanthum]
MNTRLRQSGPIAWMARHAVAPNLLMLFLILGGLGFTTLIRQEVFPSYETDTITIRVPLPGATPQEVEEGVILAIEEELRSIQGIDTLTATASESLAKVVAELGTDRDRRLVYDDVRQAVDRITTFPEDAEEPTVSLDIRKRNVVEIQLYGEVDERSLRMAAEMVRNRLLDEPEISQVELSGARDLEIEVLVPRAALRAYGLTLLDVGTTIRRAALDRSGGTVETAGGDILLRVADRRDLPSEFAEIPLIADPRGTVLRLGDVARIRHGFADADLASSYNGKRSIRVDVYRVGEETPIGVSDAVQRALPEAMAALPAGIDAAIVDDDSDIYRARMELLIKNGFMGLLLVLLVLSLFLEFKLAFWVAMGIPTAFLGTLIFLPVLDVSINMVSMFAFILALGIVVDDAIVVGENIFEYLQRGMSRIDAAIQGARDIAVPLAFSIITNIIAFLPLALVPGAFGKFWLVIPLVVASAFLLSWIEALFVLPAHLAGVARRDPSRRPGIGARIQMTFSGLLASFVERVYGPLLRVAMGWRYTTVALMAGVLAIAIAWPMSGRMGFGLFPSVPRDYASASVTMPVDAPFETTLAVRDRMVAAAHEVVAAHGGEDLATGISALVNGARIDLRIYLQPPGVRPLPTAEVASLWREAAGEIPAARSMRFESSFGGPGGQSGIEFQLAHTDVDTLAGAAAAFKARLEEFGAIRDAEDGFTPGKTELAFRLTEAGRAAGFTAESVAAQVRAAFLGLEALRQQDGRNEITVRVRLPAEERRSEHDVETLILIGPDGSEAPLYEVATVERGRADSIINRENGRRVVWVSANVEPTEETIRIVAAATTEILPALQRDFPGLGWQLAGRQDTQAEVMGSFALSMSVALVMIYVCLAIPFRSYVQPAIVMTAIPFGFAGAIAGHLIMGISLSIISVFGIIALSGVVINAALVMIDYANKLRASGAEPFDAMWRAGMRRFRPILLTTLTTFGGLAPMIFETSRQAQFLIPMAVSLGYGIVFATTIVLFLIPALYMILEDLRGLVHPSSQPRARGAEPAEGV